MFYNTGIATYVWVLTNRKPEHRKGRVQLIDATKRSQPLRKNLGKKNCELGVRKTSHAYATPSSPLRRPSRARFSTTPPSATGRWTVDRPLRIEGADPNRVYKAAEIKVLKENGERSEGRAGRSSARFTSGARKPIRCAACSRQTSAAVGGGGVRVG